MFIHRIFYFACQFFYWDFSEKSFHVRWNGLRVPPWLLTNWQNRRGLILKKNWLIYRGLSPSGAKWQIAIIGLKAVQLFTELLVR